MTRLMMPTLFIHGRENPLAVSALTPIIWTINQIMHMLLRTRDAHTHFGKHYNITAAMPDLYQCKRDLNRTPLFKCFTERKA